jgi:hypothetical protein
MVRLGLQNLPVLQRQLLPLARRDQWDRLLRWLREYLVNLPGRWGLSLQLDQLDRLDQ